MPRLTWDSTGKKYYENGVDRGVLYVDDVGTPWNGLTSISEEPSSGSSKEYYMDGIKYLQLSSSEEFAATINAYTYPKEFGVCNGTNEIRTGLMLTHQPRKSFGLSYRSFVGNDVDGNEHGYKLHIVYNALAAPSNVTHNSLNDSPSPVDFSWALTTKPPILTDYRPTAHVIVDTRYASASVVSALEDVLYGTNSLTARLPTISEVIALFDSVGALVVTDNGDGTYTAVGPDSAITMLDATTYQITWPTAIFIDANTYTISS